MHLVYRAILSWHFNSLCSVKEEKEFIEEKLAPFPVGDLNRSPTVGDIIKD
jgi:hypothetical protein